VQIIYRIVSYHTQRSHKEFLMRRSVEVNNTQTRKL